MEEKLKKLLQFQENNQYCMLDSVTIGVELIGFAAAFLTTIAFIPQVLQVCKTKSVEGLSFTTYIIFIIGVFSLVYSWVKFGKLISMIAGNFITVILALIIIYFMIIKSKIN